MGEYTDENAAGDAHQETLADYPQQIMETFPESLERAVGEAAYAFSERGQFIDFDGEIKDPALMIQIWAIVETIRRDGDFPADLRM